MARRSRHGLGTLVVGLFVSTLLLGGVRAASAHDSECVAQLREVPMEELLLPTGYAWSTLWWNDALGFWNGSVSPEADNPAVGLSPVWVTVMCSLDAAAAMAREQELHDFFGHTRLGVAMIGDESAAVRPDVGEVTIRWRNGSIVGEIEGWSDAQEVDFGMLEQLAMDVDALLP